jgi:hypothetical protein
MYIFNNKINVIAEDEEIIKNYIFTEEESKNLLKMKELLGNSKWKHKIDEVYKLWLNNYSTSDIAKRYNVNMRTIQLMLKKIGLSRDKYEAQAIAKNKRNYRDIILKGKNTMLKNGIGTSNKEEYTRQRLNQELQINFPDDDIIVGLNNRTVLNGKEIDIPIVVIRGNKVIKIAVEYDGYYWHKNKDNKTNPLKEKGYKLFIVCSKENATDKQINEDTETTIKEVITYIENSF